MRLFAGLENWKIGSVAEGRPSFRVFHPSIRVFHPSIHLTILGLCIQR